MQQMAQEHQGPLMKACQRMCVVAWQTRYFVLRGPSLLYYSDSSCSFLKGNIRLDTIGASVTKVRSACCPKSIRPSNVIITPLLQVGELVLFLENVRNLCKAGSSKSAFRLKAQSTRECTAWALALDSSMAQSASVRIPTTGAFPPITENIFDKYKQTEEYRHNQHSQIHSAVSAKSGNESTASSAMLSQRGHAAPVSSKTWLEVPSDSSVQVYIAGCFATAVAIFAFCFGLLPLCLISCFQSVEPSPQEVACSMLRLFLSEPPFCLCNSIMCPDSAAFARCLWQSGYHIDYVAADIVRFAFKHHRNVRLQKQQADGNYAIPTWRQLRAAKVLRAAVHRM
jgi:hypothetical protein